MINLLPADIQEHYLYARRNTVLRRWLIALIGGGLGIIAITFAGMFYMQRSINAYTNQANTSNAELQRQKLSFTEKEVKDITNSLKLATQVLSREVLFSQLLKQIAVSIPSKANLTNLSISQTQGGIDLSANATDYDTATQVQVNLQDPANKIFSKADLQNISCATTDATDPRYPCTVTIRALFAKNNPFLFINNSAHTGAK